MHKENINTDEFDFTPFGNAIKKARIQKDVTIEELAEQVGVSARYISAIENEGKSSSLKTFVKIAAFLDFSIDEIVFPSKPLNESKKNYINKLLGELDDKSIKTVVVLIKALLDNG